jgi:hypothetical protein
MTQPSKSANLGSIRTVRLTARARACLLTVTALAASCTTPEPPTMDGAGTRAMADTLASLYATALTQPERYEFLNRERVAKLEAVLLRGGRPGPQQQFLLARERLLAGDTRAAITALERLEPFTRLDARQPQTKEFYDLLGIAYMRLAEQENCLLNPNSSVCILGALRHEHEEGARKAVAMYERILAEFPDDRGSQWLLNVAHLALGTYPSRVPRKFLIPGLTRPRDARFPVFYDVAREVGVAVTGLAGGLCADDFDRDGLVDLFATQWGLNDPIRLLQADGRGTFTDRSAETGLTGIVGGPNCSQADVDNDGDTDILVVRGGWLADGGRFPKSLLRNNGDGTFSDVTFAAGLGTMHPSQTSAWADFDRDGWLDVFVGNESGVATGWSAHPSELWRNNRDGTFTEISKRVGITLDAFVKGVAWGDVNNDGLPDLFASVMADSNRLFLNRGGTSLDEWRFEEATLAAGVAMPKMSFPTWFFDYDNDGWEDLLVLSYDNRAPLHTIVARQRLGLPAALYSRTGELVSLEHSHLYHNRGDGTFEDVSRAAGLADKAIYAMGSNFGDIDNDGWLDFYVGTGNPDLRSIVPNLMFRGVNGTHFEDVTLAGGFGHLQKGHGTAFLDLDRDGDEDVYMVLGGANSGDVFRSVLFENPGWPGRAWITLRLEGRAANRQAVGARVEVTAADSLGRERRIHRTVGTGGSFGAGPAELHVGLGSAATVRQVRVTWPDSSRSGQVWTGLLSGHAYHLVQGEGARLLDRPPVPFRRTLAPVHDHVATP